MERKERELKSIHYFKSKEVWNDILQGARVESLCGSISLNHIAIRSHDFAKADQRAASQEERYGLGLVLSVCCVLCISLCVLLTSTKNRDNLLKKIFELDRSVGV